MMNLYLAEVNAGAFTLRPSFDIKSGEADPSVDVSPSYIKI